MEQDNQNLALFQGKPIRKIEHDGEMYFSVVDIIEILTDSPAPRQYWNILKKRENQLSTVCLQLKLPAADGKMYKTDCANTEGVLRIIMSVPSPKAEPFKLWLAEVGKREMTEMADPELGFDRLRELYKAKGYTDEWISKRITTIDRRKALTDEWKKRGITEGSEYSILTATIAKETFGLTPTEHAQLKSLDKQNLRDNMTPLELIFVALGEEVTRTITVDEDAQGFMENHDSAQRGGKMAGRARRNLEQDLGKQVISAANYLQIAGDKVDELPKEIGNE